MEASSKRRGRMTKDEAWKELQAISGTEPITGRSFFLRGFAAGQKAEREACAAECKRYADRAQELANENGPTDIENAFLMERCIAGSHLANIIRARKSNE